MFNKINPITIGARIGIFFCLFSFTRFSLQIFENDNLIHMALISGVHCKIINSWNMISLLWLQHTSLDEKKYEYSWIKHIAYRGELIEKHFVYFAFYLNQQCQKIAKSRNVDVRWSKSTGWLINSTNFILTFFPFFLSPLIILPSSYDGRYKS